MSKKRLERVFQIFIRNHVKTDQLENEEEETTSQSAINYSTSSTSLTHPIFDLNHECLFEIFKYLSFIDHVKILSLSSRFADPLALFYRTTKLLSIKGTLYDGYDFSLFNLEYNCLNLKDYENFVNLFGHFIENISYDGEHLIDKRDVIINKMNVPKFRNLRQISLSYFDISNNLLKILSKIKSIECLKINNSQNLTGTNIEKFENLKVLHLSYCPRLEPSKFIKICSNLKKLKELDITACHLLNALALRGLVNNLKNLEVFSMWSRYNYENLSKIAEINKLKCLKIGWSNRGLPDVEELLEKLAINKKDDLISLSIINYHHRDTISKFKNLKELCLINALFPDETFLEDISKLKELKTLSLQKRYMYPDTKEELNKILNVIKVLSNVNYFDLSENEYIDEQFILEIIEFLKKHKRHEQLSIKVYKTKVDETIKNHPLVLENKNLIKIYTNDHKYSLVEKLRKEF